mgnify:CR=1 FL=1
MSIVKIIGVMFLCGGNIGCTASTNSFAALANSEDMILFECGVAQREGQRICAISISNRERYFIKNTQHVRIGTIALSPTGNKLSFVDIVDIVVHEEADRGYTTWNIIVLDQQDVRQDLGTDMVSPSWSPDATQLAFYDFQKDSVLMVRLNLDEK